MSFLNRIRVLLSLIIIALFACILLRWENGPEQQDNGLKIIHKRDRWTTTNWVELYGNSEGVPYSGDEQPIFSPSIIKNRTNDYLAQDEFAKRIEEENQRELEWEENQEINRENYEVAIKEIEVILTNHLESISNRLDKFSAGLDVESTLSRVRSCNMDNVELPYKNLIERKINQKYLRAYDEYCTGPYPFYRSADPDIESEAKELAVNDLTQDAWADRNSLTNLSYITLALLLLGLTVSLMIRNKKK